MEQWVLKRYRHPVLKVDSIALLDDQRTVVLEFGQGSIRIDCDTDESAQRLVEQLGALRDSNAHLWKVVRDSEPGSGWHELGAFLDARSLIGEKDGDLQPAIDELAQRLVEKVDATRRRILANVSPADRQKCKQFADKALRTTAVDLLELLHEQNFFLTLLGVELTYLRQAAPLTNAAAELLLAGFAESSERDRLKAALAEKCVVGLYDDGDIDAHLWLVASSVLAGTSKTADRFPCSIPDKLAPSSGLNFMRKSELLTRSCLEEWGENPYVVAIRNIKTLDSPLVAGCFIEQYHVTRRFVEIITPTLRKCLSRPLRSLMFRYYAEEVGHEAFELETCRSLGVDSGSLSAAIPLPLHVAFIDALTVVADQDELAFFAAVMVTEGMIGDASEVGERMTTLSAANSEFQRVGSNHDRLNHDLNHASIARLAFEHIQVVDAARQKRAFGWLTFLLELNQRAWAAVVEFYAPQRRLVLHGQLSKQTAVDDGNTS